MTARGRRPAAGNRGGAPRVPFFLLVGGLLVGGLVLLLALNTVSAANELRRSDLAVRDQEVSADVAELRNEVAASAAPANLAAAAQQLGMVPAGNPAFIVELPNGRTVLRGRAKPVTDQPLDIPPGTQHAAPTPSTRPAALSSTSSSKASSTSTSKASSKTSSTPSSTSTSTTAAKRHHATHHRRHPSRSTSSSSTATPTGTPTRGGKR